MRSALLVAGALLASGALAGCGDADEPADDSREPVTPQALAVVAAERAGVPSHASGSSEAAGTGAELRYRADGEYDGDLLAVGVATGDVSEEIPECGPDSPVTCVDLGDETTLYYDLVDPEEDPGYVSVVTTKGDATVLVHAAGETITADPRTLDLRWSVDDLVAIAQDPRVDVTTTPETVAAGEELSWWTESPSRPRP